MVKASSGKDKKALRKAETERLQQLHRFLWQLNEEEDLLTSFPAFHTYDREGLSAGLRFYRADQLPPALLDWALALTGRHMRALYEASPDWGWSDTRKRAELAHPDARYIVATTTAGAGPAAAAADPAADPAAPSSTGEGQPLAFLQFRFEEEAGDAVLYLYEIQVEAAAQGKGLGFFLMRLLELLAWKSGVSRVMLTVFHANQVAVRLYCKLGFVPDESSPEQHGEAATYVIMTKRRIPIKPKPTRASLS